MGRCVRVAAILAGAVAAGAAGSAGAQTRYDYDVYVGGSQVADLRVTVDRVGDRYRMVSEIELVGLAAILSDWKARGEAEGALTGARPVPVRYASYNLVRGENRRVEIAYDAGTVAEVIAVPSNEEDARDPVSPDQQRGTVDPLSAVLAASLSPADCGGDRRLFDGRRLTEIRVQSATSAAAPVTDYGIYAGPATLCRVSIVRTGGTSRQWEGERQTPSDVSIWLAPVADDLAVPVRLEAETSWGFMRTHLMGVHPLATN